MIGLRQGISKNHTPQNETEVQMDSTNTDFTKQIQEAGVVKYRSLMVNIVVLSLVILSI